jgi:hypothetical protein
MMQPPLPRWLVLACSPDRLAEEIVLDTWDYELAERCWRAATHDYARDRETRWTVTLYRLKPYTTPPVIPARQTLAGLPYDDPGVEEYYARRDGLTPPPREFTRRRHRRPLPCALKAALRQG